MEPKKFVIPQNVAAERAVLAGLCQYGSKGLTDVSEILKPECFLNTDNQMFYKTITNVLDTSETVDVSSIMANGAAIGLNFETPENVEYLRSLFNFPTNLENIKKNAVMLKKLEIIRRGQKLARNLAYELGDMSGTESVSDIISKIEAPIIDFSMNCGDSESDRTELIGKDVLAFIEHLKNNKGSVKGIPSPISRYNQVIGGGRRRGGIYLIASRPKVGKAQPYNAVIQTPNGPKRFIDLKIGDKVCGVNGTTTKIVSLIDWGKQDAYQVTFNDNTSTICHLNHEWEVKNNKSNKWFVKETKQLINDIKFADRPKWSIKLSEAYYDEQKLDIHPYVIGVLLGDGDLNKSISFSNNDLEIVNHVNRTLPNNYKLSKKGEYGHTISRGRTGGTSEFITSIKKLGLQFKNSYNKFIPDIYKYNSIDNRYALLSGLLDTDGYVDIKGNISYSTCSEKLKNDIIELVQSIGGICTSSKLYKTCQTGNGCYVYNIYIKLLDISKLDLCSRKLIRIKKRTKGQLERKIVSITKIEPTEMMCISVSSKDGLYLTNDCIVTHNSTFAINDSIHVAKNLGIPVLYLDTEMSKEGQLPRILANLSNTNISDIEDGKFGDNDFVNTKVIESGKLLESIPFYYRRIAGKPFEEIMSIIRKWVVQDVGQFEGRTKDCLVIYDYFKLMDSSVLENMQEFQALGFQISALADFCGKYDITCSAFVQVNRDGITKESSDIISQSDRLLWLCSSFAILKRKTREEILQDGPQNGDAKLIPTSDQRFGPGLEETDYINLIMDREKGIIREGKTAFELQALGNVSSGFNIVDKDIIKDSDDFEDDNDPKYDFGDSQYRKKKF